MRAATTVALALCAAAALFAGAADAVPIARDRTSHHHRLQQRVQRSHRTATSAADASDADADATAQWFPVFPPEVGPNRLAAFDLAVPPPSVEGELPPKPTAKAITALAGRPLGAAVYVHEAFRDHDRDVGFGQTHTASTTAPGLTAANVRGFLRGDTTRFPVTGTGEQLTPAALDAWFTTLSGEGVAPSGARTTHNHHSLAGDAAPVSKALFNGLWDMFGSPVGHWGIAVARYRFTGRLNIRYDVYWIAGADNTELGPTALHTEYQIMTALKQFEDHFLLAGAIRDRQLDAPVEASAFTERHINWVLLFFPCADGNRGCDFHIAAFDGRKPDAKNLKNPLDPVVSQCPAATSARATSHVVYFKNGAEDNSVVKPA